MTEQIYGQPEKHVDARKPLSEQKKEAFCLHQDELSSMRDDLTTLGKRLEKEGRITLGWGDSYSRAALDFFMREFNSPNSYEFTNEV